LASKNKTLVSHDEAILQLQKFIAPIHPLREEEWDDFASVWQPFSAKRKTVLTAAGDTEKYLYFVTEVVQRAFYQGDEGKEATIVFTYAFSFSGVIDSFLLQTPSRYCLETLTKSEMIRTSFYQLQELMDRYHNFEKLIRKATNFSLAGILERQIELQCFSAEEKFKTLLRRSPHVLTLIPHKYLASYLGIDASTFSKLLATVRV
jgi:CRP-like cAMP-binding protein